MLMGFHMFVWRKGHIKEATIVGVSLMILAVVLGRPVANSAFGSWFLLSRHQITIALAVYGFAASVLPVWMLLTPRDYLSTFMKIGTIMFLVLGVVIVHPTLQAPAISQFAWGGGPIIPGPMFPFVFITIACGAISGFHSLIATGTTPKMIDKESDIRPIGYGAMLFEGLVGGHGHDRRHGPPSRRLFRDQHLPRGLQHARPVDRQSCRICSCRSARTSSAARAAPSPSPSAWRTSSARFRGCAA